MDESWLDRSTWEKDLGILDHKMNMSTVRHGRNNSEWILGCINRHIMSRLRKLKVLLYSTLVRSHVEYCIWVSQLKKDIDKPVHLHKGPPWPSKIWKVNPMKTSWRNWIYLAWGREGWKVIWQPYSNIWRTYHMNDGASLRAESQVMDSNHEEER